MTIEDLLHKIEEAQHSPYTFRELDMRTAGEALNEYIDQRIQEYFTTKIGFVEKPSED